MDPVTGHHISLEQFHALVNRERRLILSPEVREQLRQLFRNVDTLICENNYRDAERHLALRNFHLTATEVGTLAVELQPQQLVLFHVSDRYSCAELQEQLQEVRGYFPNANFPKSWQGRISEG